MSWIYRLRRLSIRRLRIRRLSILWEDRLYYRKNADTYLANLDNA